jgi:di/tricarboxylate transporter
MFIILIILCFLSLIVFAFDNNDVAGRSSVVLTLILTFIAFKFTIMSTIPRVSYTTILDYFMLYGLWILSVMTIIAIIPNFFVSSDMKNDTVDAVINWSLLWAAVGSMVLGYSGLSFYAYSKYRSHQQYHIYGFPSHPSIPS